LQLAPDRALKESAFGRNRYIKGTQFACEVGVQLFRHTTERARVVDPGGLRRMRLWQIAEIDPLQPGIISHQQQSPDRRVDVSKARVVHSFFHKCIAA
jgi:hypothetical protein